MMSRLDRGLAEVVMDIGKAVEDQPSFKKKKRRRGIYMLKSRVSPGRRGILMAREL